MTIRSLGSRGIFGDEAAGRGSMGTGRFRERFTLPQTDRSTFSESVDIYEDDPAMNGAAEAALPGMAGREPSAEASLFSRAVEAGTGIPVGRTDDVWSAPIHDDRSALPSEEAIYDDVPQPIRVREHSESGESAMGDATFLSDGGAATPSSLQRAIASLGTPKTSLVPSAGKKSAAAGQKINFPAMSPLNNLYRVGQLPELGVEPSTAGKQIRAIEKKGYADEVKYMQNITVTEPLRYTYRQRLNKVNDPEMDPANPLYDYDKWFDKFILKTKLSRLIKPENFRASNDGMYYPYDYRRYVVRSPHMNPDVYAWINDSADAKMDPELVKQVTSELEELQRKSKPNPKNLIYAPDGDAIDATQNFDLMHLSDQYMAHEYADLDKLKAYLEGGHPFGTHLQELIRRVMNKVLERMPSRKSPPQNPWSLHGFDGQEIARLKDLLNRHRRKPVPSVHAPESNPIGPHYDAVLDLHRTLYKKAPRDARSIFGAQIDEMRALQRFTGARSQGEPWEAKALRATLNPNLPHPGSSAWAPATPYEPMPTSPHYGMSTFNPQTLLSVLPEAAPLYTKHRSAAPAA